MKIDKVTAIAIAVLIIFSSGLGYYIGSVVAPLRPIQEYTYTITVKEIETVQVTTPLTYFVTVTYPPYTTTLTYTQTQVVEKHQQ